MLMEELAQTHDQGPEELPGLKLTDPDPTIQEVSEQYRKSEIFVEGRSPQSTEQQKEVQLTWLD